MRDVLEAMHDYPDEALGLFFFLIPPGRPL